MRPDGVLINTSRGPVVDQAALYVGADSGSAGGGGPGRARPRAARHRRPAFAAPNVVFTPHNAGQADEVWPRIVRTCFANVERVARGEPPQFLARPLE